MEKGLINIDEDLNLFEESDWDFFSYADDNVKKCEYFNDISEYNSDSNIFQYIFTIIGIVALILAGGIFLLDAKSHVSKDSDVDKVLETVDNTQLVHVSGKTASSENLIGISNTLDSYFKVLKKMNSYNDLHSYCTNNSLFADNEELYRSNTISSYDISDCKSRALKSFGGMVELIRINEVIEVDNKYYCYATLSYPDYDSLYEYYMKYSYEMTKYFKTHSLDTINVTRYMMQVISNNDIPRLEKEYLFLFTNNNGVLTLDDDSSIVNICNTNYTNSVEKITSILGGSLATGTYQN